MTTLYLTCPTCGAIDECEHDPLENPIHTRALVRWELAEKWRKEYEEKMAQK